jgi:phospholipase/lecithinase/hemolysin
MASWGAVPALTGFHYSAIDQSMEFAAKPGKWFWSNGYAWGTVNIDQAGEKFSVDLKVLHGNLNLKTFKLKGAGNYRFKNQKTISEEEICSFEI